MKKILMAVVALAVMGFVGCQKDDNAVDNKIKVNFAVADKAGFDNGSRAVKAGWEAGDQILVVFKGQDGLLDIVNGVNTLTLEYNGTAWVSDTESMPESGLKSGCEYFAIHHPGEVTLGSYNDHIHGTYLDGYKGGEQLIYVGTYTLDGTTVELGTIVLERTNSSDIQVSVKDLTGENWKMSILADKTGSDEGINITHEQDGNLFVLDTGLGSYAKYVDATGVEYGGDVSFYFSVIQVEASQLVFVLSNGTDTYYYTKTGVTSDTLQGGYAYWLPAITDLAWETE